MKLRILTVRLALAFLLMTYFTLSALSQYTVDNAVNATDGVQNVLLGGGVTATGITFQGTNEQVGSFSCVNCGISLSSGLVIGTGNVNGSDGPNNSGSFSSGPPAGVDGVTDPDLADLSGMNLNNTAVLEFDFVPTGDSLFFNFVFSSEEYPEYVNSINDAFGFFLSGPGITGPYLNNAANIALVPGTNIPISINTVNIGENATYYNTNVNAGIQADAYTDVMTAIAEVICGETYHIKIAIGDASDGSWDSWVFLEAGSFQSNQLSLQYNAPGLSSPLDGGMYEGCEPANLTFTREGAVDTEQIYDLSFSGTAQQGADISVGASQIIFPIGVSSVTVPLIANQDAVLEGLETLTITVIGTGCSNTEFSVDVNIYDLPQLVVDMADVLINCGEEAIMTPVISGGLGNYNVVWESGVEAISFSDFPDGPTSYNFTITDTCGVAPYNGVANVVFVVNPPIVVDIGPDLTSTCLETVEIGSIVSGGFGAYSYAWNVGGELISTTDSVTFIDSEDVIVELVISDICDDTGSDELLVQYPAVPLNVDLGADFNTTCLLTNTLIPNVVGGTGAYSYQWNSDIDGDLGTSSQIDIQTGVDNEITLEVIDECGNEDADVLNVLVPAAPVIVNLGVDITSTCLDANTITSAVSGGVGFYSYQWNNGDGFDLGNSDQIDIQVGENTEIILQVLDECGNSGDDELEIFIPALPVNVNLGADLTVTCLDESSIIPAINGGVGEFTYEWVQNGVGSISSNETLDFQTDQNTSLTLTVTDECGNEDSDVLNIAVPTVPVIVDFDNDLSVTCLDVSELIPDVSGGIGNLTYSWSDGGYLGDDTQISYQTFENATINLTVTDECGNIGNDEIGIQVPQMWIAVDLGNDVVAQCIDEVELSGTTNGGIGNYFYSWQVNGDNAGNSPVLSTQFPDDSEVMLTVTDECGNSTSDEVQIVIPAVQVTAAAGDDMQSTCITQVPLSASATGGVGTYNYDWSGPDGIFSSSANSQYTAQDFTTITLTVTDQCGNTDTDQLSISIPPVVVTAIAPNDTVICVNQGVFLSGGAFGGTGAITMTWEGFEESGEHLFVAPQMTTTYILNVHDQCGNIANAEVTVAVTDVTPNFTATFIDEFTIAFTNTSPDADYVVWEFSDGDFTSDPNPVHEFNSVDTWTATLTAYADGTCRKSITQEYFPAGALFVPNAFTPDNDGINDVFFIKGHDIKTFEILIFNRYGEIVYKSDDIEKPWDGSARGGDFFVPDGPYNYMIKATDSRENIIEHQGSVIILR